MERGPIFIAGIERSGTSLIYALLASHPNIAMTRRTNLWSFFYNQYGDLARQENFERCLAAMMRYKRLLKLNPDPERIRREFWQGAPTYPRLFALLEEHYAQQLGKPRWGDKSLNQERYVDQIFAAYPDAKMIQMLRDPRDRYASALTRWKVIRGRAGSGLARWLWSVEQGMRNQRRYPERYLIVRYEQLAAHPEATLRTICAFIGEEYSPAMLTMEGAPAHRNKGGNSSYGRGEPGKISTSSIGRFRKVLSPRDVLFMQAYAGARMAEFGYQLEPLALSGRDRLLYTFVDWPFNLVRMLGWRAREALRDRLGRSPAEHTIVDRVEVSGA
ncbi:MAG TPA: sulfotransferase [Roseiflexaceae bacterium]|nr:sulfotransferase [Roseiflexaceae bacterium]